MVRIVANEVMPGLGLASNICRFKTRLRVIESFAILFLFSVLKIRLPGSH